jgi:hypothetical protein
VWSGQNQEENMQLMSVALIVITISTIFNSRIGDRIVEFTTELWIFFPLLAVCAYLLWRDLFPKRNLSRQKLRGVGTVLLALSALLAIRVDSLQIGGVWYHTGYFTGVVQTVKAGGILLWDTPSQYGFLNMLVASSIPIRDASRSFFVFQAVLLFVVSTVGILSIRSIATHRAWAFAATCFVLLQYLADPELIGPQPYPSSSAVRFGPSLIVLALVSLLSKTNCRRSLTVSMPVICSVALLWSFESFFYTSLILGGWFLAGIRRADIRTQLRSQNLLLLVRATVATVLIAALYSLYVLLQAGRIPSWRWFYLVAAKYAEGHGSLPIDPWGAGLLIVVAVGSCILIYAAGDSQLRQMCGASIGGLLGWLSYYIGRSHSSNIIAMFPLIFFAILLPTLGLGRSLQFETERRRTEKSIGELGASSVAIARTSAAVVVAFAAIFVASLGGSSKLPGVINGYRPLPRPIVPETVVAEAGKELGALLESLELRPLPIAYSGLLGSLPPLSEEILAQINPDGAWLPLPLALLEEPIPEDVRLTVLARRHERLKRDGYFVWDKQRSIHGRAEAWLRDINLTHMCRVVAEDSLWQVSECTSR